MKSKLFILIIVIMFISKHGINKNKQINVLLLKNIECLATPEKTNPKCYGLGCVDCPNDYEKVNYIIQ